ncbi:hypothetical protein DINM_004340 [Dirofilaria immitis]|nr:hypothetical protein [Dirofilaria immitis]
MTKEAATGSDRFDVDLVSFVEKDLLEKEKILYELHIADSAHYDTVNSMMSWECRSSVLSKKGSRILLRLDRALLFIVDFLKNLKDRCVEDQLYEGQVIMIRYQNITAGLLGNLLE